MASPFKLFIYCLSILMLDMVSPSSNYDDLDIDYEEEASKMFQNFMSSSNVESKVMADLGMDKVTKKFKDPRPKMEQRHQMVCIYYF